MRTLKYSYDMDVLINKIVNQWMIDDAISFGDIDDNWEGYLEQKWGFKLIQRTIFIVDKNKFLLFQMKYGCAFL